MAEKIYYSMGEVAEMLDVTQSLLRFWERKFDIIKPAKNKKGNRLFTPEDVRNLKTIYHLVKERGMTLDGARKHMKANRGDIGRDMQIAERLASIRALLVEVRNSIGDGGENNYELRVTNYEFDDNIDDEREEIRHIVGEAKEEEAIDTLTEEVIEELHSVPEEIPDFDPEPVFEPEEEEEPAGEAKPEEPPKPTYIEQTLF